MPSTPSRAAPGDEVLDLRAAGVVVGYSPEYLRKLLGSDRPPPLHKIRGRFYARRSDLEAWLADRQRIEIPA